MRAIKIGFNVASFALATTAVAALAVDFTGTSSAAATGVGSTLTAAGDFVTSFG